MAHYAYIDETQTVTRVIAGPNEGTEPPEIESWESYFTAKGEGKCLRTSYNTYGGVYYNPETREPSEDQTKALRKNYAGLNFTYDPERDAFIPPKPFDSWILNESTCLWEPPVEYPNDENQYVWNEETTSWDQVEPAPSAE